MSRIEIQTLVLAFEKRIEALEKNPPDKVPTSVILNMLEKAVGEVILDHFQYILKKQISKAIEEKLYHISDDYVKKSLEDILQNDDFKKQLETSIKKQMLKAFIK